MNTPIWIELEDCLSFHEHLLARFGGLPGIRDEGLLASALARPQQLLNYGKPDLFEMAAAYAFGIARNHPFLDGNKRSALMAAALFLEVNGYSLEATEESAVEHTLALAAGAISEEDYAAWLKKSCVKTT
jgi:death on curing protein